MGHIKKLASIQYETLKGVFGAYRGVASNVLEKKAVVLPLRIWLEHVLELELTKMLFSTGHGNSIFERL